MTESAPTRTENSPSRELGSHNGGTIPGTRKAAFALTIPHDLPIPVLIAVPHGGRVYPDALRERMRQPDYSSVRLEDRFIDHVAAEIAQQTGAGLLIANAPRAMIDLNRASDDIDWDMIGEMMAEKPPHSAANRRARSGLGLVPRRLPGLGEIWTGPLPHKELTARIDQIHAPYHAALGNSLEQLRDRWGAALLVDLHSMPPLKKRHSDDAPAQLVVGDRFGASASDRIVARAINSLSSQGARVTHNRPYAGGYVLDRHGSPARNIHAVQIEVCRSLYLDLSTHKPAAGVGPLAAMLTRMVRDMAQEVTAMIRHSDQPLAAE